MLNAVELGILDGCANHYELSYFLFAEVNYVGGVVQLAPGDPNRRIYPRIED